MVRAVKARLFVPPSSPRNYFTYTVLMFTNSLIP